MTDDVDVEFVMQRQWEASQRGALSMWTIYDHPRDYPDVFVARRHEASAGQTGPTADVIIASELHLLREIMAIAGLTVLMRSESDEPQIVEVWL